MNLTDARAIVDAVAAERAPFTFYWRIERCIQGRWVPLATKYRAASLEESPQSAWQRYQRVRPVTRGWQLRAVKP